MFDRHGYSLGRRQKFQNVRRESGTLRAEYLKKFRGFSSQSEPVVKNLWVLQPNGQPLTNLRGELPVLLADPLAGYDEFELPLDV